MKFADLLSLAKNVPLSSFDWGPDTLMFVNRRLDEANHITIENTGTDIHARLLSLKPADMLDLLQREVELNGTRLNVLEHPVEVVPEPTPIVSIHPNDGVVAVTPSPSIEVCVNPKPPARWPIVVATIMASIAITLTLAATSGEQLGNQNNRNAARTTIQLVIEVLRTLNGNPSTISDDPVDTPTQPQTQQQPSQQPAQTPHSQPTGQPAKPPTAANPYGL